MLFLAEEAHELAPLVLPLWAFPVLGTAFFVLISLITLSFRDVTNRRPDKADAEHGHGHGGH